MDAATRTERSFCTTCGWALPAGARSMCAACGGSSAPLPLVDSARLPSRDGGDEPGLGAARDAWALGDHPRALERSLTFDAAPRSFTSPVGPGWVAAVGSTPVFAALDVVSAQLTLEVPVARLPLTKRVPALRAALALCDETTSVARLCLRQDLLIARFAARLDALSPAIVRRLAREIAAFASGAQEQLASAFDARPAIPEQGVQSSPEHVGRSIPLPGLAPPNLTPPSSRARPAVSQSSPPSRPTSRPSAPSVLQGMQARPITLRLTIPPALSQDSSDDDMPAILSPDFAEDSGATPPTMPPPSRPIEDIVPRSAAMLPPAMPSAAVVRPPPPSPGGTRPMQPEGAEASPTSRRMTRQITQDITTPEGKLCELCRQALALATALSFEEKPHTMLLLVRAAVFRAVHDHVAVLPSAVAYLYRATRPVTREIWMTKADPARTAATPIPVAEPALGALEQILAARAGVPKEKPAVIEPWTSAAQAKEHLAKYLTEIELAPADPTLRHYLALGALCELLVRARLPTNTDQRLRDIVAYAQRDGAKPQVIELMMTALRKIVAG